MKLVKCKLENFRSYKDIEFNFSNLSVIVGKNDVGKSTLFDALDIFFENNKALEDDVNIDSNENKFSITCFFQVDSKMPIYLDSGESERTQTTLEDEYLLNQEHLVQIKKIWEKGKLSKTYIVCNHPTNWEKPLIALKIQDLKKMIPDEKNQINRSIKKEIRNFLFLQENLNFKEQEIDISTKDTDIVSIYSKLKEKMPKFLLFKADRTNTDKDNEISQITKAITQNAISEIEQKFNDMKENILQDIKSFASATLKRLKSFDENIVKDLAPDITSKELSSLFSYEFKSDNGISFNKRGSGVKRLFLLSFFLEDAERKQQSNMIYAIEEPETSQHPNYQRIIIESLQKLAQNEGRQILLTTHTPEIVRMTSKENIIFIQKNEDERIVHHGNEIDISTLADTLGVLPYLIYQRVLFVEGESDVKFLNNLNNKFECLRNIFDIKTITLIPLCGGGNVKHWMTEDYLKQSNVKCLYFLDRDENKGNATEQNLIKTKKREIENYYPIDVLEKYFKDKLDLNKIFSDDFKRDWDNQDIAKYIFGLQSRIKEQCIKSMFADTEIWDQINENNMQSFDEIKQWFKKMKDFFNH